MRAFLISISLAVFLYGTVSAIGLHTALEIREQNNIISLLISMPMQELSKKDISI